jgi:hypothetical protein
MEIGEQQVTFRDVAAAQLKAWREAAEKIHGAAAFSTAVAESRAAFDRANQTAWEAFKRAAPPKT